MVLEVQGGPGCGSGCPDDEILGAWQPMMKASTTPTIWIYRCQYTTSWAFVQSSGRVESVQNHFTFFFRTYVLIVHARQFGFRRRFKWEVVLQEVDGFGDELYGRGYPVDSKA
jgi:hypothetical protein